MTHRHPKEAERRLRAVASPQGGYFTAAQALQCGYSYRLQHFHRESGNWLQIERGVLRFPDYPATPHEDLIRWSLWSRDRSGVPRAVVSHDTALTVHELGDVMPGKIHLTVPEGFRKRADGAVLHRAHLAQSDIEPGSGFRVTTPLRTLLDAAQGNLSPEHLISSVWEAIDRGLVRRQQLEEANLDGRSRERLRFALAAGARGGR